MQHLNRRVTVKLIPLTELGEIIAVLVEMQDKAGWTGAEMSEKTGVSTATIGRLRAGNVQKLDVCLIDKWARACGYVVKLQLGKKGMSIEVEL